MNRRTLTWYLNFRLPAGDRFEKVTVRYMGHPVGGFDMRLFHERGAAAQPGERGIALDEAAFASKVTRGPDAALGDAQSVLNVVQGERYRTIPDEVRKYAENMEFEAARFYRKAAETTRDASVRQLLVELAEAEVEHESMAQKLEQKLLTPSARAGSFAWNNGSMRTVPVKYSAGPLLEGCEPLLLMSIF